MTPALAPRMGPPMARPRPAPMGPQPQSPMGFAPLPPPVLVFVPGPVAWAGDLAPGFGQVMVEQAAPLVPNRPIRIRTEQGDGETVLHVESFERKGPAGRTVSTPRAQGDLPAAWSFIEGSSGQEIGR